MIYMYTQLYMYCVCCSVRHCRYCVYGRYEFETSNEQNQNNNNNNRPALSKTIQQAANYYTSDTSGIRPLLCFVSSCVGEFTYVLCCSQLHQLHEQGTVTSVHPATTTLYSYASYVPVVAVVIIVSVV